MSILISTKSLFMCLDAVLQIMENVVLLIGTRTQNYSVQSTLLLEGDVILDELQQHLKYSIAVDIASLNAREITIAMN